ncbi:hypothetical protein Pfo_002135 [Paulownia fortunei]|nr:hypothetical protein Pfo_002135 [Paulownia fortunei]
MVLQCYTWILHLFKQIIGDRDDITAVNHILTTLPAQTILQWPKVYKEWRMLTSSHQSRDRPLILRYYCDHMSMRIFIIDGKSEKEYKERALKRLTSASFIGCCNGLVLLTSHYPSYHIVLNPLSKKIVTTIGDPITRGRPCGFFFHPLAKEYRILTVQKKETTYEYQLYLFGAKIWRRTANPYFYCRPTYHRNGQERLISNSSIVNGVLHWYIGRIMIFDIITEEFSIKPLPFEVCFRGEVFPMHKLLVKEDRLCFCHVGCDELVMDIWILDDYANWSWVRKYIVNLDWDMIKYPIEKDFLYVLNGIRVVSIHKDELVLFWAYRGMFSYHLGLNEVEKIYFKKSEMDKNIIDGYDCPCNQFSVKYPQTQYSIPAIKRNLRNWVPSIFIK